MISLNTINQINDIMTVLNNTRKAVTKQQPGKSYDQVAQEVAEQPVAQEPALAIQQTTIHPSMLQYRSMLNVKCCVDGCNKSAVVWVNDKPYCKEHDPESRVATEED